MVLRFVTVPECVFMLRKWEVASFLPVAFSHGTAVDVLVQGSPSLGHGPGPVPAPAVAW